MKIICRWKIHNCVEGRLFNQTRFPWSVKLHKFHPQSLYFGTTPEKRIIKMQKIFNSDWWFRVQFSFDCVQMYRMMLCYLKNPGARRPLDPRHQSAPATRMFLVLFSLLALGSCVPFLGLGSVSPFRSQEDPPAPVACVVHGTCYQGKWAGFGFPIIDWILLFKLRMFTV